MAFLVRAPALQALLIQLVSLLVVVGAGTLLARHFAVAFNSLAYTLLQGLLACALSAWCRMPRWWLPIQLLFAPAAVLLLALDLPSWLFLALFLAMVLLYGQTFRTRVPYYPSSRAVRDAVAGLLPAGGGRLIDIGSGFGGLVLDLGARRPDWRCSGIEMALLPWLCSVLRARAAGNPAHFVRGDYEALDLGDFDVVFAYLSPAAMPALWRKAQEEMQTGSLLLSYEFPIPGVPADASLPVAAGKPPLYAWRF